jgi:hypothetical protein
MVRVVPIIALMVEYPMPTQPFLRSNVLQWGRWLDGIVCDFSHLSRLYGDNG